MRLHQDPRAPNPRRVRIYLAEKGLADQVTLVEVPLATRANEEPAFLARNPIGLVPVLELDDGRHLRESMAIIRYLEVTLDGSGARVLLPVPFSNISKARKRVEVDAIKAEHFAGVPRTKSPDQVTRLEEDMISGYYGGGTLYATPQRQEPWL